MPMTDQERTTAIEEINEAYTELAGVLDSLTENEMLRPGIAGHWNGRDLLSHLAAWDIKGARHITARDAGQESSIPPEREFDDWNEQQVSKTRDWTIDQVRAYFDEAHQEFVQLVRTSPTITPCFATGLTAHHYREHIDQFRNMKSQ